jgi:hypothetical protein
MTTTINCTTQVEPNANNEPTQIELNANNEPEQPKKPQLVATWVIENNQLVCKWHTI